MQKKSVNIIILNYNGVRLLEKYMPSVMEAARVSQHSCRVSVIDNKSGDNSVEFLRQNYKDVYVYEAKENRVLCSFNDYLDIIDDEIVIFMNNDIALHPGFVDPLISHFENPDIFFVAPKECSMEGIFRGGANRGIFRFGLFKNIVKNDSPDSFQYTLSAHGAAFDRKKVLELGGFDDLYLPGYAEDLDLCYRGWKRGWFGLYEPKSIMLHEGGASFEKAFGGNRKLVIIHRNNFLFFWKNVTSGKQFIAHIIFILPNLILALLTGRYHIVSGFLQATRYMGSVSKKRAAVCPDFILSDEEVLSRIEEDPALLNKISQKDVVAANIDYHNKIACQYEKDASTLHIFDDNGNSQKRIKGTLAYLRRSVEGDAFLDIGCGTGNVLKQARVYFKKAVGADVSIEMLKIARKRALSVILADATRLPWPDGSFDAISAFSVVHHFLDPADLFKEIHRVLKPDGFLYTDWDPNAGAMALFDEKNQSLFFKIAHTLYMALKKSVVSLPKDIRRESEVLQKTAAVAEYHHHYKSGLESDKIISDLKNLGFSQIKIYFHNNAEDLFKESRLSFFETAKIRSRLLLNGRFRMPPPEARCMQFAVIAKK